MLRAVVLSMTDALARVVVATCDEAHAMRAREALQGLERVVVHNLNLEKCQLPYLPRATAATLKRCLIQRARRERHIYRNEICESWLQGEDYAYVMYNDADLVLHARCIRSLGKAMDEDPTLIILPHKLQTFAKDDDPLPELGVAPSIRDLTHDVDSASCCDSGTYPALKHLNQGSFDGCQNFWYNCPRMLALYDFARFAEGTYTPLLMGNEHGRKCLLSETREACDVPARRRLAAQRQYLVPLLAFGPNNQFEGLLEALTVAKLLGGLYYYLGTSTRTIEIRILKKRNSRTSSTKSTLREFTDVEFVDEDVIKLWKTSPKILASPLNKERLAKAFHNVGFDQAPRKKAFVRSHSRAADVAQAFKGFSAAGAVFVALCVFSVLPCRPRCRPRRQACPPCDARILGTRPTPSATCAPLRRRRRAGPAAGGGAVSGPVRARPDARGDLTGGPLPRRREGALRACSKGGRDARVRARSEVRRLPDAAGHGADDALRRVEVSVSYVATLRFLHRLLDNIVRDARRVAHLPGARRRRGLRGRAGCTVGESGGAGLRRADGVDGHERRL